MRSLSHLQDGRHLRVRGSEKPGNLFGQSLVGSKAGQLALPQVEVAAGQPIEVAGILGRVVVFRGHARTIADRSRRNVRSRKARLFALRYRR